MKTNKRTRLPNPLHALTPFTLVNRNRQSIKTPDSSSIHQKLRVCTLDQREYTDDS